MSDETQAASAAAAAPEDAAGAEEVMEEEFSTLPPFANARNRELDRQLRAKEQRLGDLRRDAAEQRERLALMAQHLRNVEAEVASSQGLLDGKQSQAAAELRLAHVAERTAERTRAEIDRLRRDERDASERVRGIVAQAAAAQQRLAAFGEQMQWTAQELERWAAQERAKEEDRAALERFQRADEAKVKELTLATERLVKELHRHEALLEGQVTEARSAQIELGKMEQAFRELNREHQKLIALCEESVASVQRRDKELEAAEREAQELDAQVRAKRQAVQDKHKFLDSELQAVAQAQAAADAADRALAKKREEYGVARREAEQFQDELETLRMTMQKVKSTVDAARSEAKDLERQVAAQEKRVADATAALETARQRAAAEADQSLTREQRAKAMEQRLKEEEQRAAAFDRELAQLKQEAFHASQDLFQFKQREANVRSEIEGARAAARNLRAQIRKLDNESMKQQEVLYNQEFQLQELEQRASKLSGHKTSDEKAQLNAKIAELTAQLEKETQKLHILSSQHKKAVEGLKAAKHEAELGQQEEQALNSAIATLEAETEKTAKILKAATKKREELVIQENSVRLDAKRLRDMLYKHADEVYSLEAWRHEQSAAIEEARMAIATEEEALRAQIRTLDEARHLCVSEQRTREIRVDKLRRKYALLVAKAGGGSGDDADGAGEQVTQEMLLVRAAQEREEMRMQRAKLEEDVAIAESEVAKLEKTMAALNAHATKLADAARPTLELTYGEKSQKAEIEQAMAAEEAVRKERHAQFAAAQAELSELRALLQSMGQHNQGVEGAVNETQSRHAALRAELAELTAKLDRAKRSFARATSSSAGAGKDVASRDLALAELKDTVHAAMYSLSSFADHANPDVADEIRRTAATFALEMPSVEAPPRSALTAGAAGVLLPSTPLPGSSSSLGTPGGRLTPKSVRTPSRGTATPPIASPLLGTPGASASPRKQQPPRSTSSSSSASSGAVTRQTPGRPPPLSQRHASPAPSPSSSSRPGSQRQTQQPADLSIGGTQLSGRT